MKNISLKVNWISIVMLLSLGINFFVIGFIYSQHKGKEIRMTRLAFDNSISKLVEPFPRKGKHDFYVTMRSKRSELIPIYRNIMSQRSTIMAIIAEDQLDNEKLRNAMNDYHDIYHDMVGPSQEVMIKIIGGMELEDRKAIFERYKNPPKRSNRDRDRDDDDRRRSSSSGKQDNHDW
jgi:uncharacterized membrane protein